MVRLRDHLAGDEHTEVAGAGQDVDAGVWAPGMDEDLLVLLEPRIHRLPIKSDVVAQLLER